MNRKQKRERVRPKNFLGKARFHTKFSESRKSKCDGEETNSDSDKIEGGSQIETFLRKCGISYEIFQKCKPFG